MMYSQSIRKDEHIISVRVLHQIGAMTGHDLLLELDRKLSPQELAVCSKEDLQALFLIVFGTILAIGYFPPATKFPPFPIDQVCFKNLIDPIQLLICRKRVKPKVKTTLSTM
jgi:hypothetical protein